MNRNHRNLGKARPCSTDLLLTGLLRLRILRTYPYHKVGSPCLFVLCTMSCSAPQCNAV